MDRVPEALVQVWCQVVKVKHCRNVGRKTDDWAEMVANAHRRPYYQA